MQTMRGLSLFRNTWPNEVICPTQPEPVYYMYRTLSTALEDVQGADVPVTFSDSRRRVESYGFVRENGEKLIAFWLPGVSEERGGVTFATDLTIKGGPGQAATIIDVLDGTEKPLNVEMSSDSMVIRGIRVQDWPLIIRLPK
jgi:hypothetical protein